MTKKVELLVAPCDYKAARYAITNWHYSKSMTYGKTVKIGVWENNAFIGCICFGRGASFSIHKPYKLEQTQVIELVRVALNNHLSQTSKIVSMAVKLLSRNNRGLRLIVSYADSAQNHIGVIYQAMSWVYTGESISHYLVVNGKKYHTRTILKKYNTCSVKWLKSNIDKKSHSVMAKPKYKYILPLDKAMRRQILPLAQPYPKKVIMRPVNGDSLTTSETV